MGERCGGGGEPERRRHDRHAAAHNVSRRFGGLLAVNNVSFELRAGEIVGLIGPNGAGKTTLVNLITGVHRAGAGEIWYGESASIGCRRIALPGAALRARSRSCSRSRS
jgi:ABC-type branched-subunit amino acid transport system ATPase component